MVMAISWWMAREFKTELCVAWKSKNEKQKKSRDLRTLRSGAEKIKAVTWNRSFSQLAAKRSRITFQSLTLIFSEPRFLPLLLALSFGFFLIL